MALFTAEELSTLAQEPVDSSLAEFLATEASGAVLEAAGVAEGDAGFRLKQLALTVALRAFANPAGDTSETTPSGYSRTYGRAADGAAGVYLTDAEEARARRLGAGGGLQSVPLALPHRPGVYLGDFRPFPVAGTLPTP